MADTLCIFEDPQYVKLLPLVYTRPVYDLRCGILTLREKIERAYPDARRALLCRPYLAEVVKQQNPNVAVNESLGGNCLLVNGRILADEKLGKKIPMKGKNALYISGNTVVAVRMNAAMRTSMKHDLSEHLDAEHFGEFEKVNIDVPLIEYPWHLVNNNGEQIVADYTSLASKRKSKRKTHAGVHLLDKKNIFIEGSVVLKPGVVLDAESGPIYIGKNAKIFPNAVIEGPAFIGGGTLVKIGAKIYGNTSIGEMCKIGGEVEASIIHSYTNKQHDGFLGHSYLGMWCNLGADTNNSDLKNNYGNVKVHVNGTLVDTGAQFAGLTMGDHSKSGINTMFNTGTVVGVSCNVFGAGYLPKFIPSFSWGGGEGSRVYDFEKSLVVARQVMARRKVQMTDKDEAMLKKIFELSALERKEA